MPRVRADVGGGGTGPSTTTETPKANPRPKYTGPPLATKILVAQRDGGMCVGCGAEGDDYHHRKPRGQGGSSDPAINSPANLIVACRTHHEEWEAFRLAAKALGRLVSFNDDPTEFPVWVHPGRWVLLHHDGSTSPVDLPPPNAERAWQP